MTPLILGKDSDVDGIDGDMVLETLLNDNLTRIRRYPKEFLVLIGLSRLWYALAARPVFYDNDEEEMRLQDFIKVPNPFDVVCTEKKLSENERSILEQTTDVVTPPSDQVVNLGLFPIDQEFLVDALPPPTNVRKRTSVQAPARESALKKGKCVGSLAPVLLRPESLL
ncbi:hypothetical protein Tco_0846599 [Tanacetum coccineum]